MQIPYTVEQRPDTFITLIGGERVVVHESMEEVMRRAVEYQQHKNLIPPLSGTPDRTGSADASTRNSRGS